MKSIEVYKKRNGQWHIRILFKKKVFFHSAKFGGWPRRADALKVAKSLFEKPPQGIFILE